MPRIQLKRGLKENLPNSGLLVGEPLVTTDRGEAFIAVSPTETIPIVPAVADLETLASIAGAADLIMVYDDSETDGRKVKKMTVAAFRTALAIPDGSSDEMVAVVQGGQPGYLYGTDGTDGVLRMNSSLSWTKDSGDAFVTLAVNAVDGGTF